MIRTYKGIRPRLGERVYVDASAQVIGDVELGDHASVWMNAVVRGDVNSIRIGPCTNIQDNCVVHVFKALHPTIVADHVTVGHSVTLHGCRIGSWCLIGMGATILNGAKIGDESIVAAGTLVPEGMEVPAGSLVMGLPAKVRRPINDAERESLRTYCQNYLEYKETYLAEAAAESR
jgi:carbonic anhydrase/acetyltransferase-like protein (isoleucine patch superfamily)